MKNEQKKQIKKTFTEFVLAGDIGATNTRIAVVGVNGTDKQKKQMESLFTLQIKSSEIKNISDVIKEALRTAREKHGVEISRAGISAAGTVNVERNFCKLTNLELTIDAKKITAETKLKSVTLMNDVEAVGYGIRFLDENNIKDVIRLDKKKSDGKERKNAVKGIIAAGTGLGKAAVYCDGLERDFVLNSEGGHEDAPASDSFEYELLQFAKDKRGGEEPVDYEAIVSGKGIVTIYEYLIEMEMFDRTDLSADIFASKEGAAEIAKHAKKDAACKKTMEIFMKFYARALRNMALDILARGGMYIAGGIAAKNKELFTDGRFMREFENNYAMKKILKEIPVYLIVNDDVGLYGAVGCRL
jgi:glucokinase